MFLSRKLTRTEFEKWHHIHAGLPLVAHVKECCLTDFGVVGHQGFCSGALRATVLVFHTAVIDSRYRARDSECWLNILVVEAG